MRKQQIKISGGEISTTIHATESDEKVLKALENVMPHKLKHKLDSARIIEAKGYYGNPMKRVIITLKPEEAFEMLKHIIRKIDDYDYENFIYTIDQRFDGKNKLFIRISKQDAYRSAIKILDGGDIIRLIFTIINIKSSKELVDFIDRIRSSE